MFLLKIITYNAAFNDETGFNNEEVSRLLQKTAKDVEEGKSNGVLIDSNGNRCGAWALTRFYK